MADPALQGHCDERFESVRSAFLANFTERDEIGAAVAVTLHGESVVDLWGGHADPGRTHPWQRDTLVHVYSTTKGMTALCANRLADRGELDLDAPVSRYWPEFAQAGKGEIPVRWLLCHRSGLVALREPQPPGNLYDWQAMCEAFAAEAPWFPPGEHVGYQAVSFGWLVGEVVRRVAGRSLGRYFQEEIAVPLGADFHIGLGEAEIARCADITAMQPPAEFDLRGDDPFSTLPLLAFVNPMGTGDHNCEAHRRAEIPAINGHGTARGLARIYGALAAGGSVGGVRVLSTAAVDTLSVKQAAGIDEVQGVPVRFGPGFQLNEPGASWFAPGAGCFGHHGAGGSAAFADRETGLAFAYVCNRMGSHLEIDPRARVLIDACTEALG